MHENIRLVHTTDNIAMNINRFMAHLDPSSKVQNQIPGDQNVRRLWYQPRRMPLYRCREMRLHAITTCKMILLDMYGYELWDQKSPSSGLLRKHFRSDCCIFGICHLSDKSESQIYGPRAPPGCRCTTCLWRWPPAMRLEVRFPRVWNNFPTGAAYWLHVGIHQNGKTLVKSFENIDSKHIVI